MITILILLSVVLYLSAAADKRTFNIFKTGEIDVGWIITYAISSLVTILIFTINAFVMGNITWFFL